MEYQTYQSGDENVKAYIEGTGGGTFAEGSEKMAMGGDINGGDSGNYIHGENYLPVETPSSSPYPIPETVFNSMENINIQESIHPTENQDEKSGLPLIAKPPPHVMTSLGPMPLPVEVRRKIPEKFVAKPIIEEREIYVAKKEVQERTVEIPHIQYEHKFSKIPKMINIKKLVPSVKEIVREVPREVYKPVIEEKVIEVPQGVKYVEVPVEVPCYYPPKIVPKPKEHIVERVVETIKPVVKEKIIEVPQTVVKNVPKIKTVEVPYFVPKYVEKIIEVPYQPGVNNATLPPLSSGMPLNIQGIFQKGPIQNYEKYTPFHPSFTGAQIPFKMDSTSQSVNPMTFGMQPPMSDESSFQNKDQSISSGDAQYQGKSDQKVYKTINVPYESKISMNIAQPINYLDTGMVQHPVNTSIPIELPTGVQWGAPPNAPPPPSCNMPQFLDYPSSLKMPPMMVTFPPEVGQVTYCGKACDPDILTRSGVMPYNGFKKSGTAQILFPPLPYHAQVPMKDNGVPDIDTLNGFASNIEMSNFLRQRTGQSEDVHFENPDECFGSPCCRP